MYDTRGVARIFLKGDKRGLEDGSPPAEVWGRGPQKPEKTFEKI